MSGRGNSKQSSHTDRSFVPAQSYFYIVTLIACAQEGNDAVSAREVNVAHLIIVVVENFGGRQSDGFHPWKQPG
jgi:hypothetical protein